MQFCLYCLLFVLLQERLRHTHAELDKMATRLRELARERDGLVLRLRQLEFQVGWVGGWAGERVWR